MKRDPRLRGLSTEHHHALVIARGLARGEGDAAWLRARFDATLAPHFAVEEELLLPALAEAGGAALAARTLADHAALRAHLEAAGRGEVEALRAFGELLAEHVRFEERELFPACEELVPQVVLDAVAAR